MRNHHHAVLASLLLTSSLVAADWPQFLGAQRNGVADVGAEIAGGFPVSGPKILWTHPLGSGFAGPAVADGKVIVIHRADDQVLVEALDVKDGTEFWHFTYVNTYADSYGLDSGPRATPTIAQGKVILHGAEGRIHVLDLTTGKLLWHYDTVKELDSPQGFFGRVCPPLVIGSNVILAAGGKNDKGPAGLIALNLADGKVVWQSVDDEASYSAPIFHETEKLPALICWMRNNLVVCDARDGSIKYRAHLRSEMDASVNAATPIWCGDKLFLTASYDVGASLWAWEPTGKLTEVWKKPNVLDCHYSTPVYKDGYLYGLHGRQEFGQSLRCVRVEDGKLMWESGKVAGGTLLLIKDTLVLLTEAGELSLIKASSDKYESLAQDQILRAGHRSYPAFANGVLYARDGKQLIAVDLLAK
ncbi:PQQ-like beta-propeller repeat protein [soil metagenome]